jgi:anti-sigma regulatory factor (Ser/Thr protein kinase)
MARAIVRDATAELGLDDGTTWELMLATTEAVANAVEHGSPCDPWGIQLRMELAGGCLHMEVADCGRFESAETRKPEGHGGRGIRIIAAIMDDLEVVPDSGTTRVRFEKRLAA